MVLPIGKNADYRITELQNYVKNMADQHLETVIVGKICIVPYSSVNNKDVANRTLM